MVPEWVLISVVIVALLLVVLVALDRHYGWPLSWLKMPEEPKRQPVLLFNSGDSTWPRGEPDWSGLPAAALEEEAEIYDRERDREPMIVGPGRGYEVG